MQRQQQEKRRRKRRSLTLFMTVSAITVQEEEYKNGDVLRNIDKQGE